MNSNLENGENSQYFKNIKDICERVNSKMIRDEVFRPQGLSLLEYQIIPTTELPIGAAAAVDRWRKLVYINCGAGSALRELDEEEFIAFALNHEMFHPMLFHHERQKHRDQEVWWIACDYSINMLLFLLQRSSALGLLNCRGDNYKKKFCLDERFENMLEEEIYDYLKNNCNFKQKSYTISLDSQGNSKGKQDSKGNKDKQNQKASGQGGEIKVTETTFKVGNKEHKSVNVEFTPPPNFTKEQIKEIEEKEKESASLARQMFTSSISRGVGSSKLQKYLKRLFKVKVDWRKITQDAIATALEKSWELHWGRPSFAYLANFPRLAYQPTRTEEEKLGTVWFAIDESGSMGDDDVRDAVGIVYQSKDLFKDLFVMKHDYTPSWEKYYESMDDVDVDELLIRRRSGGTSHKGVFERLGEYIRKDSDRMVSCVICITDMDSDIESYQDMLPTHIPVIYITNNNRSRNGVRGKVIRINE